MKLAILFMTLVGCRANMINAPGIEETVSEYAPVNEMQRPGVIKYLNQGADTVIKSRREDAYEQMFSACNGRYKIDTEGAKTEGGIVIATSPNTAIWGDTQYWYIQFSCIRNE